MSLNVIAWVLEHSPTVGTDKVVLLTLADRAHHDGTDAYPGIKLLAQYANVSERTVQDALKRLELGGHITVKLQGGKVKGVAKDKQPNAYAVAMSFEEIAVNRAANGVQVETRKAKFSRKEKPGAVYRTPKGSERGEADRTPNLEPGEVHRTPQSGDGVKPTAPGEPSGVKLTAEPGAVERTSGVRSTAPKPSSKPNTNQHHRLGSELRVTEPELSGDGDEGQKSIQNPTPNSDAQAPADVGRPLAKLGGFHPQPKPMPAQVQAGITSTGLKNIPGAAATPLERAARALERLLAGNPHNGDQVRFIPDWLEAHHPEYILAVVRCVQNGEGVKSSGIGLLLTALNSPGSESVPDFLRTGRARLEAGLPFTLERRRGWYRLADGRTVQIHRWSSNGAHDLFDQVFAPASTRLWAFLGADWQPEPEEVMTPESSEPEHGRISPEAVADARARLGIPETDLKTLRQRFGVGRPRPERQVR